LHCSPFNRENWGGKSNYRDRKGLESEVEKRLRAKSVLLLFLAYCEAQEGPLKIYSPPLLARCAPKTLLTKNKSEQGRRV